MTDEELLAQNPGNDPLKDGKYLADIGHPNLTVETRSSPLSNERKAPERLKITYENYGEAYTAELPWDADLSRVMLAMMNLLVAASFSKESIEDVFKEGISPWEWN